MCFVAVDNLLQTEGKHNCHPSELSTGNRNCHPSELSTGNRNCHPSELSTGNRNCHPSELSKSTIAPLWKKVVKKLFVAPCELKLSTKWL